MQAPSELDKAVEYTKQFIDAMTPVAKQAYEIGLFTLQIDAAQALVMAVVIIAVCVYSLRRVRGDWLAATAKALLPNNQLNYFKSGATDHLPMDGIPHIVVTMAATIGVIVCTFNLVNVWNWTKLVAPQLWLAHQAIEKLIK
jgi:hypothetical protein